MTSLEARLGSAELARPAVNGLDEAIAVEATGGRGCTHLGAIDGHHMAVGPWLRVRSRLAVDVAGFDVAERHSGRRAAT